MSYLQSDMSWKFERMAIEVTLQICNPVQMRYSLEDSNSALHSPPRVSQQHALGDGFAGFEISSPASLPIASLSKMSALLGGQF